MKAIKLLVILAVLGFASAASAQAYDVSSLVGDEIYYTPPSEACSKASNAKRDEKEYGEKMSKRDKDRWEKCNAVYKKLIKANPKVNNRGPWDSP